MSQIVDKKFLHPTHIFVGETSLGDVSLGDVSLGDTSILKEYLYNAISFIPTLNKQSVIYISPEKNYVLEDIEIIFDKTRFALNDGEYFCFVLKKADRLTPVCANKLLKLLEEPPAGYLFFLLTNNENAILPTIKSRSQIHHIGFSARQVSGRQVSAEPVPNALISFITDPKKQNDFFGFEQELKKQVPSEPETTELIYRLIGTVRDDEKKKAFLEKVLRQPPQAGGAMLFWKKLFLTFPRS